MIEAVVRVVVSVPTDWMNSAAIARNAVGPGNLGADESAGAAATSRSSTTRCPAIRSTREHVHPSGGQGRPESRQDARDRDQRAHKGDDPAVEREIDVLRLFDRNRERRR